MNLDALHRRLTDAEVDATCAGDIGRALRIMSVRLLVAVRLLKRNTREVANDR